MEAEPLDVCPEPEEDDSGDDGGGSDTFWCSDEVGGSPDVEIPFDYVNDGDEDCGDGSDEPQDMDPSVDSDGDGDTTNDVDNWFDCNDGDGSTVPMDEVNDGWDDCPNGADEGGSDGSDGGDAEMDLGLPSPEDMECGMDEEEDDDTESDNGSSENGTDEEDFMPSAATMETAGDGTVYINMTYDSDDGACDVALVATPDSDGNMTLTSMTMSNGTATMTMETWFDVTIDLVVEESNSTEWEWAAPDLVLNPNTRSLHTFDCGDSGVVEEDEDDIYNTLILFNRVNDDTTDCADESDEAVDYDGDGTSDTMFHCETPDDITDDISMYLVNDGNMSDCPNDSDEYMQDGSSWGEFNWNSSDSTTPYGYSASLLICEDMGCIMPYSGHNISADELSLEILMTDSSTDEMDLDGQCSDMISGDKESLPVLLSVPFNEMDWTLTGTGGDFTDANGKNWYVAYIDINSNGFVDLGDQISLSSQDTTDLYFTCVEIHDDMSYVDMYTGETPNSMPGFTALMVSLSLVAAAFVAVRREDE
jgi:PGF-CTERM protein